MKGIKQVALRDAPLFCRKIYADGKGGNLLYYERHNLRGKPDYVYRNIFTRRPVPMELKSRELKEDAPQYSDLMQLVAYFLITEDAMGLRPRVGYLRYKNAMFKIKNTLRLRKELLGIIADMRQMLETGEGQANPSFVNCRYCVAKETVCEFNE